MLDSLAPCTVPDLHAALALDAARRPVVVCASPRQAQALHEAHAGWRLAQGSEVWETPAILSVTAFTAELHERSRAALALAGAALPPQIGDGEARVLWRLCIDESREPLPLLRAGDAAALAAEAWQLCHEYRLALPLDAGGFADVERFNSWALAYRRRLERLGVLDAALADVALLDRARRGMLTLPTEIVLAGFEDLTPRLGDWLQVCVARGVMLRQLADEGRAATPRLVSAPDEELELRAAAQWARAQLQGAAERRIAVIVPDLGARRAAVQRIFDEQLCPQSDAPDAHSVARPYDLTLGAPLSQCAPLQTALQLLQFAASGLDAATRGALFASNHWGEDDDVRLQRCAFEARLRREGWLEADLATLLPLAPAALREGWRACAALLAPRRRAPSEWAEAFTQALAAARWPGPRALDSEEFQMLARWREVLLEFAALDRVLGRVPLSAAVSALRELADRTLFQPQAGKVALQVMGVLEAQGLHFDALWVTGIDDERWPPASRPHPFIPHALQRRHGLPHASAQRELAYARAQLDGWRRRSGELVLSLARSGDGRECAPSPLLADWQLPIETIDVAALPASWQLSFASSRVEAVDDAYAPPPAADAVLAGGTRVLGDQARCPFRGYAVHRLGARPLDVPGYGLDAVDRGVLVHRVLELLWSQWGDQATLLALSDEALVPQLQRAVDAALDELQQRAPQRLQAVLRGLEAQRLAALVRDWLDVEKARAPFRVLSLEKRALGAAGDAGAATTLFEGLQLRLRPDRVDVDEQGRRIVLDYKTGARKPPPWAGGRPEDPQLLLYALTEGEVGALAFARLAAGDVALQGVACEDGFAPGIVSYATERATRDAGSWAALHGRWRGELATLAEEIRRGWAAVAPKHPRQSCRDCGLHALCRIREDVSLDEGEEVAT
ncbi:PD-(D/E)XK nuclease family protein [Solimonas soli]|uniref:PD-(D/E)XK nuclease family protein n=1 Tax=Solimonas soli TaxID=413479 RepID=UPI0004BCED82|nr:PD-(D/E)XK nuclease family protein [Solimonas soli]